MNKTSNQPITLAVAGLGAIGMRVAQYVDQGKLPGVQLVAVSAKDASRAMKRVGAFRTPPAVALLPELADLADVVVECTPASVFRDVAAPAIAKGRYLLPLSVGALLNHMDLVDQAEQTGARIVVPTGALVGLDTVRAMAVGKIEKVRLITRKPPSGLTGAPYLIENKIDLAGLTTAKQIFSGTAREAAKGFPANVNVAAALAFAGIGPDQTAVEIWADAKIDRNIQTVIIESDSGEATMTMNNIPSAENPRTGRIVANSVIATLQRLTAPLIAGS